MTPFLPQETIRRKRDGGEIDASEIAAFTRGLTDGSVSGEQTAAFAMAVFFRGMSIAERVALTQAMTRSGRVLAWPDIDGPVLDKHSTGGVGDKVSLVLAPLVAACGGFVPMISGRGLGHTGGTCDKLESIPGYRTAPGVEEFQKIVRETGCAIIGQTDDLAPADRRLYAIRDVTATVESVPLITASILSKKLAAGLGGLAMDVAWGSGAFMARRQDALDLARSLAEVAAAAGLPLIAQLTDMNAVRGRSAGNAVEVMEAIDYLTGQARDERFHEVVTALAGEMLQLGKLAADETDARTMIDRALSSGAAAERFSRMVAALGGPADLLDRPAAYLSPAPRIKAAIPPRPGVVTAIDVRRAGLAVVALGGGRRQIGDRIDPSVGLTKIATIGETVGPEHPLALIHARDDASAEMATAMLQDAFTLGETAEIPSVLGERVEQSR